MKNRNLRTGLVAILGGAAAATGCAEAPQAGGGHENADSVRLEQRLKELAETPYRGELAMAAMCYEVACPETVDYHCPTCGNIVSGRYSPYDVPFTGPVEEYVASMRELGYDVELDRREFCPRCNGGEVEYPELIFRMRFSPDAPWHEARSNIADEYGCVAAFLAGKEFFLSEYDQQRPLHDNIDIIRKMTGLGSELTLPENPEP